MSKQIQVNYSPNDTAYVVLIATRMLRLVSVVESYIMPDGIVYYTVRYAGGGHGWYRQDDMHDFVTAKAILVAQCQADLTKASALTEADCV